MYWELERIAQIGSRGGAPATVNLEGMENRKYICHS
jgi:hypothetical protein